MSKSLTRSQRLMLIGMAACATAATYWLTAVHGEVFRPYFGRIRPLLAILIATVVGVFSLLELQVRRGLPIYRPDTFSRSAVIVPMLAIPFAIAVVVADGALGYPEDINVPYPESLLFYPVMAWVAEMVFHAFPLALVLAVFARWQVTAGGKGRIWRCIALVALIEPAFQLGIADWPLSPASLYTGVHVYATGLVQLAIFRRYDFVSMILFRLVYYLLWHILWGYLRLQWI